jgi:hypothetical protein
MTLQELKNNIEVNNIPSFAYSIDGGLTPNAHILYKNYSKWEYFYLDERGGRNGFVEFSNEEAAFEHLWKKLETELKYPPSIPPKSVYGKQINLSSFTPLLVFKFKNISATGRRTNNRF